jgi:hypothetical protein
MHGRFLQRQFAEKAGARNAADLFHKVLGE